MKMLLALLVAFFVVGILFLSTVPDPGSLSRIGPRLAFALDTPTATATATATATSTATATATSTATATATSTAVPLPTPVPNANSGVTHSAYFGSNPFNGIYGGYVVRLTATDALICGQLVIVDASNDDSVVVATSGATAPLGIVVGTYDVSAHDLIGKNPAATQTALIQVSGIMKGIADGTITRGTKLMTSASAIGGVAAYSAGTVDEQIGVALSSSTAGKAIDILLYK